MAGFISRAKEVMHRKRVEEPKVFMLYFLLRALVLVTLVRSAFLGHYEHMMLCVLTLLLLLLPSLIEHTLDIELPDLLESIILLFIFAAEILGEIDAFYIRIPFWDTILHTTWGFLCAGIGFALFDILNRSDSSKIKLTPLYMAISAIAFSMCIGACWEIFEYFADCFIGVDMQKDTLVQGINTVWLDPTNSNITIPVRDIVSSQINLASGEVIPIPGGYLDIGIHDTMADLIVNLIGALVFAVLGFAYVKTRDHNSFAARFIPRVRRARAHEKAGR
ncbi:MULTISPECIES: hypothetical protein [unclassified Collinsella]|uniref:hypothetical protein n=1 Tax=unclassified Collinsella TaxID=2637548 RepID=UPI0011CAD3B0|nr:hypothetical protein [Collinsella sp. BA40]TXF38641.1 hypothetical protein E4J93_01905 [Collinsella sp. BA40]